jgi:flavin-dependent dehydrogenase
MRRTAPLILGAGPAGCSAAIILAQAGASPLLLDSQAEVGDPLCGGFLSWRTAAQLCRLGIDPAALGARPVDWLVLLAREREAAIPLPGRAFGLSRHALDQALRRRALALGAELAIDFARGIEGQTVIGRQHRWTGDGLFLATGKHDVRGLARPRRSPDPALGLRLRLPASAVRERLLDGRIELHAFRGGYAGIVLQEDGWANVCLAVRKSLLTRHSREPQQLLSGLATLHPALAERLGSDWQEQKIETIGAVPYGWVARTTGPGQFRLGDQAAVIPSLAGEGIGIALASGTMAARGWLEHGPAGAEDYQHRLALVVRRPMAAAALARRVAESPFATQLGVGLARHLPRLLRTLMEVSRVEPDGSLAQARAAP